MCWSCETDWEVYVYMYWSLLVFWQRSNPKLFSSLLAIFGGLWGMYLCENKWDCRASCCYSAANPPLLLYSLTFNYEILVLCLREVLLDLVIVLMVAGGTWRKCSLTAQGKSIGSFFFFVRLGESLVSC